MLNNQWCYCGFSLKNVEKSLVLLCARSKMLKKHWFYSVFFQHCWKTFNLWRVRSAMLQNIGFILCSLKHVETPCVLHTHVGAEKWEKHWCCYKTNPDAGARVSDQQIRSPCQTHSFLEREWGTLIRKLFVESVYIGWSSSCSNLVSASGRVSSWVAASIRTSSIIWANHGWQQCLSGFRRPGKSCSWSCGSTRSTGASLATAQ